MMNAIETFSSMVLIDAAWVVAKALVILAGSVLVLSLLPKIASAHRYSILFYALVATLLLPLFASALPSWHVVPDWFSGAATTPTATIVRDAPPRLSPPVAAARGIAPATSNLAPRRTEARSAIPGLPAIAVAVWLIGVLLLVTRTGLALRRLGTLTRQAVMLDDDHWLALADDCARRLGLQKTPGLRFHPEPIMPMTTGFRLPVVLLPIEAQDWSVERKRDVLLHELAHVKRQDLAGEWVSLIACTIQWFNPLVWWTQRKLIIERERACDDMVIEAGADPTRYAGCLLQTAAQFQSIPAPTPGMARVSDLETRLLAVLDKTRNRGRTGLYLEIGIVAAGLVFVLPVASLALDKDDAVPVATLDEQLFSQHDSDSRLFRDYATVDMHASGESALEPLLKSLAAASAVDRAAAAQALGGFKDPRVVQALIASLGDRNWHVREWSARSLGDIGDAYAVSSLVSSLTDDNAAVREWAARALGDIADSSAVDGLVQGLVDRDDEVREWAARSLGDIGSPRAVDALIASLQDADVDVREWALRALGDIGDPRAMDAIAALINDQDPDIREWSMRSLATIQQSQNDRR